MRKLCTLPCHSCFIYGTWRSKEVGGLKPSYGGKGGKPRTKGEIFMRESHKELPVELTPQVFYLNYQPISASFGVKRWKLKFKSVILLGSSFTLLIFFIKLQMTTEWAVAFQHCHNNILLIYYLNIPDSYQNPSSFPVEGSVSCLQNSYFGNISPYRKTRGHMKIICHERR